MNRGMLGSPPVALLFAHKLVASRHLITPAPSVLMLYRTKAETDAPAGVNRKFQQKTER
jgi:hypothetical protein